MLLGTYCINPEGERDMHCPAYAATISRIAAMITRKERSGIAQHK
jgi:hypothetical protein